MTPAAKLVVGAFALAVVLLVSCQAYEYHGTLYADPQAAPDFELLNVNGGNYRLSASRGKIVLMYFGYTFCPDICPGTLAHAREMFELLGQEADKVDYLFITVDPERDTPAVMSAYVAAFHPRIIGLTGEGAELQRMFEAYGIVAEKELLSESAVGYVMNHTTRVFLIDQAGRLRLTYPFGTIAADMAEDLSHLLE
jgi:protein SCO1/2